MKKTRAVLSTLNDAGVYSGYCLIQMVDGLVMLDSVDKEQSKHIESNDKVSILVVDPVNIDRWFCIQGTLEAIKETQSYTVNVVKLILFPKD